MNKQNESQSGFGLIFALFGIILVAIVIGVGVYVFNQNQQTQNAQTSTKTTEEANTSQASQSKYLTITKLGLRIKLTDNTQDAYYSTIPSSLKDYPVIVHLAVHSLDAYSGCTPSGGGIAAIGSFKEGQNDPVVGDYKTSFPNAPKIGNFYYFIGGNQYDCTNGKASELYSNAKHDFINATIEALAKQ